MTDVTNNDAATHELSIEELDSVAGGFWKELGEAIVGGAAAGAAGGAAAGAAAGGVGAGPGAAAGAIGGGLLAGIGYCASQIF